MTPSVSLSNPGAADPSFAWFLTEAAKKHGVPSDCVGPEACGSAGPGCPALVLRAGGALFQEMS